MSGHTPGEWFYESADRGNRYVVRFKAPHYTGRGEVLAQHIERAEDAKIMAAAPALAEALGKAAERFAALAKYTEERKSPKDTAILIQWHDEARVVLNLAGWQP